MQKRDVWIGVVAFISAGVYLVVSGARGFPLDDAWIHQVYARNLGTRFEFAFFAGQPSTGSTSPLWTILLSLGYLLRIDFRVWMYWLGIVLFALNAMVAARLSTIQVSSFQFPVSESSALRLSSFVVPLFLLLEWHLVWSAVSGMEILLFIFLSLILVERFYARGQSWMLGLIAGLLTLTRPEGIVLSALVFLGMGTQRRLSDLGFGVLGLGISVAPYLLFNLATSGTLLPNTFYAKAAEYAELFVRAPFIVRWLELLWMPFVGAQILLVPGLVYCVAQFVMKRDWLALIPLAWILLLPALYALRLPVTYQHGRYEMPVIPFIVIYGLGGTFALFERLKSWVIRVTWEISIAVTLVAFWLLGAAQYSTDVAIIDCEMVQTARWVAANVPADAIVAAHDIGALGYFYHRPFIDLAGLVSPEVIPFIRDENRLRDYLFARNVTFVVVFPNWYATLADDPRFVPAFQSDCGVTRDAGEENMTVYQIK
jgi:hypothetical protein